MIFGLLQLLILLVVVGLIWWMARTYIPAPAPVRVVIDVIAVLIVIVILLEAFGVSGIPRIR